MFFTSWLGDAGRGCPWVRMSSGGMIAVAHTITLPASSFTTPPRAATPGPDAGLGGGARRLLRNGMKSRRGELGPRGEAAPAWVGAPCGEIQGGGGPPAPEVRRQPCRRRTFATRGSRPRRGGRKRRKWRSRPISRVLSWTVIPLGASSPIRSSSLPGPDAGSAIRSLFGLAPGGVCHAGLLPDSRCALTAPFHPCHAFRRTVRRSALCCTFRRLAPPRRYLAPCPVEPGLSSAPIPSKQDR